MQPVRRRGSFWPLEPSSRCPIDRRFGLDTGDRSTIFPIGPSICFAFARVWLKRGLGVEIVRWQASQACDPRNAETSVLVAPIGGRGKQNHAFRILDLDQIAAGVGFRHS